MNSFGRIFRVSIFGESHGESVGIVIDGCPAGLSLTAEDLLPDLERRKGGQGKGTTPRKEDDFPFFKSGIFNGKTTGAPITIIFENNNLYVLDGYKQLLTPISNNEFIYYSSKIAFLKNAEGLTELIVTSEDGSTQKYIRQR